MFHQSGRSTLHPGITCDSCKQPINTARYHCMDCPDFDFCEHCQGRSHIRNSHAGGQHVFSVIQDSNITNAHAYGRVHISPPVMPMPIPTPMPMPVPMPMPTAHCDVCKQTITHGTRYKCNNCPDYDLCESCMMRGGNLTHYGGMHSWATMPVCDVASVGYAGTATR